MKVIAKEWFYEETTKANYEKNEEVPVDIEIAKELEKENKVYIKGEAIEEKSKLILKGKKAKQKEEASE
jgi:hypothetical protein